MMTKSEATANPFEGESTMVENTENLNNAEGNSTPNK
jgi:hypothetical protein